MTLVICLVNQVYAEKLDVPLKTLNNERINLKDYKTEKPLYIKLWATWCQECIKQMPHYVEAYKQYHDKIDFLSINLDINDDLQAVQEIIKQYQLSMPVVKDHNSAFTTAFDAVFTPFHVLINRDGTVVHKGFEASEALDKKIALLAKKDIDAAEGSVAKKPQNQKLSRSRENVCCFLQWHGVTGTFRKPGQKYPKTVSMAKKW